VQRRGSKTQQHHHQPPKWREGTMGEGQDDIKSSAAWKDAGNDLYKKGDYRGALEAYTEVSGGNDDNIMVWRSCGEEALVDEEVI